MTNFTRIILGAATGVAILLTPPMATANPDFTKKTGKKCTHCHIGDWSSQQYTDAGKFYREHSTFKGYVPPPESQQRQSDPKPNSPEQPPDKKAPASGASFR